MKLPLQHSATKARLLSPSGIIIPKANASQLLSANGVVSQSLSRVNLGRPIG
ncbi:MAG TPA: hypothetical protein VNN22_03240 [Verrucomicrobiae bacterium]|nr:hypothetical protein [Verrucomicrobiae bacterium]